MPRPNRILHASRLAAFARDGVPFPADHTEQPAGPGGERACEQYGVLGEVMPGGLYLHFWCPDCSTDMYQVNSARGVLHAQKISRVHKPGCCAERRSWGRPSIWPDVVGP